MPQPTDKNAVWLNTTETVLLVGSVGTSVASVVLQQVTLAAITSVQLSLVLGLNSLNRKRWDDLNQRNENAIAQIQQQFLKEQTSVRQIEEIAQKSPTHQDILEVQQRLNRFEADCQQRLNQLNQDIKRQENQFEKINENFHILRQRFDSTPIIDVNALERKNHELRGYFEVQLKDLEDKLNRSNISDATKRLDELEKATKHLKSFIKPDSLKSLIGDQTKHIDEQIQDLRTQLSQLTHLSKFDPQPLYNEIQKLSSNIKEIEEVVQNSPAIISPESIIQKSQEEYDTDELKLLQDDVKELDRRNKTLVQDIQSLRSELEAHSSNVTLRFQEIRVDLLARFNSLQRKIEKIRPKQQSVKPTRPASSRLTSNSEISCAQCGKICNSPTPGGLMGNYIFCSKSCRDIYQRNQERDSYY